MSQQSYEWRKVTDKSDYPPGLQDLIRSAYVLVHNGAEYIGLFIHDEGKCWLGWRGISGLSRSQICSDPDTARKIAERLMSEGLVSPRRRSRF